MRLLRDRARLQGLHFVVQHSALVPCGPKMSSCLRIFPCTLWDIMSWADVIKCSMSIRSRLLLMLLISIYFLLTERSHQRFWMQTQFCLCLFHSAVLWCVFPYILKLRYEEMSCVDITSWCPYLRQITVFPLKFPSTLVNTVIIASFFIELVQYSVFHPFI